MLKPLVYTTKVIYKLIIETNFFGNQILVCPILEPNAIGRRMYVPRGQWYNYWTNDFVNGGRKFGLILNLTKFQCL
jgi:alpha-glucosidase